MEDIVYKAGTLYTDPQCALWGGKRGKEEEHASRGDEGTKQKDSGKQVRSKRMNLLKKNHRTGPAVTSSYKLKCKCKNNLSPSYKQSSVKSLGLLAYRACGMKEERKTELLEISCPGEE
jgi:hypothetical protein